MRDSIFRGRTHACHPGPPARHGPDIADGELELSVVMPCLNEERTLPVCIAQGPRHHARARHHRRGRRSWTTARPTAASIVAREHGARVVHQPLKGYGNALRKGFAEARGRFVLMGDCDDSYDFRELPRFVERLRGGADVVMGNRLKGEIKPGAMPWLHRWVGNPGLTWFLNLLFQTGVGDTHCGMRGMRKDAIERMHLQDAGHGAGQRDGHQEPRWPNLKIEEIPITLWPDGRDRRRTCGASATAGGTCASC